VLRRPLRHTVALAMASLGSSSAALAAGFEEVYEATWLSWLSSVRVAGEPLLRSRAALAFAWSLAAALVLVVLSALGARRPSLRPRGLQTLLELLVGALRTLVLSITGPEGLGYVPFVGSLFIYIFLMNLFGLVPGFMAPTSNLTITAALALVVFLVVQGCGFRRYGVGYLGYFVEGVPLRPAYLPLLPFVFCIHLIGELCRPVTLSLRLFGNMMAEHAVVFILLGLAAGLARRYWVFLPVQLPNLLLGMVVAFAQALVFSTLATVYLGGVLGHGERREAAGDSAPQKALAG